MRSEEAYKNILKSRSLAERVDTMLSSRIGYVEEILEDIRTLTQGTVSEEKLSEIRERHVDFHRKAALEIMLRHD